MDALEYLKTREKMCDAVDGVCVDYSLVDCNFIEGYYPEEAIEIVEKWKEEHTETYQSKLRKALPDADDFVINYIMDSFCPWSVFPNLIKPQECISDCKKCWSGEILMEDK